MHSQTHSTTQAEAHHWHEHLGAAFNLFVIGLTAFLTVVDLFATQAILPQLARFYQVAPSLMGIAANASTLGMALAGIGVALFGKNLNRRLTITLSLFLLAVPTTLLAFAPDLVTFAALRVCQGVLMATAFSLTLAHLGEKCTAAASAGAFAAYVTGNVASNLVGRFLAAEAVAYFGIAENFYFFAALNIAGGLLVMATLGRSNPLPGHDTMAQSPLQVLAAHLSNRGLRRAFIVGFCILFAFIGVFTFVNFVLAKPPVSLPKAYLGVIYLVFAPSILTTPLASHWVGRFGTRAALWLGLSVAIIGLPLLLLPALPLVLAGMVMVACGTFFAQATATNYVSRSAAGDRASASGLYLAFYFMGGLTGTALLGALFDNFGWLACVLGIGAALALAMVLSYWLVSPTAKSGSVRGTAPS